MNKLLRQKLKRKHYLRRIKLLASWNTKSWTELYNDKWTMCWKNTGKPCSYAMCSPYKYDRSEQNKDWVRMSEYKCPYDSHKIDYTESDCEYCEGCEMLINKLLSDESKTTQED